MRKLFPLFLALVATTALWAEDFSVDGIYYNYLDGNNVGVTYRGSSGYTYSNEYSGSVAIPSTVTYDGTTYSVTSIGDEAFAECRSLTSITIPESVTSIGYGAFCNCRSLTSITIPNSVTGIGYSAFESCTSLVSITLSENLTTIAGSLFNNCTSLTSLTIPNSVMSIWDSSFAYCTSLSSITIGNKVQSIAQAFIGCSSLTSIVVDSTNAIYDSRDNCNAIIETATNILIAGCQNTIIPNSVTSIGGYGAFEGCSSLTSITIPNSVTSIGYDAFAGCSSLTSITIPNSVTSIGDDAFSYCSSLTSITIPNSVTSIGEGAFSYCDLLKEVICYAEKVPQMGEGVFDYTPQSAATLYVLADALEDYKAAKQWKEFGTILPIQETDADLENTHSPSPMANSQKVIRDGQLLILRDGVEYNAMGQEL